MAVNVKTQNVHTLPDPLHKSKKKRKIGSLIPEILIIIVVLGAFFPIVWAFFLSFKTNTEIFNAPFELPKVWSLATYAKALRLMQLPVLLKNTATDEFFSLIIGIFISMFSSFAIARMRFGSGKMQNFFYVLFISGIIIPVFVIFLPLYLIMSSINSIDKIASLIFPHIAFMAPLNTLLMVGTFRSIPDSIEESAAIDGSSLFTIIFKIYLPIVMPTIATVFIINFLNIWNDFPLALIMLNSPGVRTIALAPSFFKTLYKLDYSLMATGAIILFLPQMFVFVFFQRYIIDGLVAGAVKG